MLPVRMMDVRSLWSEKKKTDDFYLLIIIDIPVTFCNHFDEKQL